MQSSPVEPRGLRPLLRFKSFGGYTPLSALSNQGHVRAACKSQRRKGGGRLQARGAHRAIHSNNRPVENEQAGNPGRQWFSGMLTVAAPGLCYFLENSSTTLR